MKVGAKNKITIKVKINPYLIFLIFSWVLGEGANKSINQSKKSKSESKNRIRSKSESWSKSENRTRCKDKAGSCFFSFLIFPWVLGEGANKSINQSKSKTESKNRIRSKCESWKRSESRTRCKNKALSFFLIFSWVLGKGGSKRRRSGWPIICSSHFHRVLGLFSEKKSSRNMYLSFFQSQLPSESNICKTNQSHIDQKGKKITVCSPLFANCYKLTHITYKLDIAFS